MISFEGKVAVVTGGANGIGAAVAKVLADNGASVAVFDRESVNDSRHKAYEVDLADQSALEVAAKKVIADLGRVDILINVAGMCPTNMLLDLDVRLYEKTLAVNLLAPMLLMKYFGADMAKRKTGRIVNVTSIHGKLSEPGAAAYDASKGGLEAVTRTAALELADLGILVNGVAPGFVNTRMSVVNGVSELESEWFKNIYQENARLPLKRASEPSEIANAVAWLASEANTYVTGQILTIDGGLSSRF